MRSRDKLQPCHTGCDSKEEGNGIDGRAQTLQPHTRAANRAQRRPVRPKAALA